MEEGIVGGRVGTKDTLRGLAVSQAGTDGGPLCGFNDFFTTVKTSFICPNADIMRSEMKDFNSEALRRDLARAAFVAPPAQLGAVRAPNKSDCGDPNDPKYDALFDCTK